VPHTDLGLPADVRLCLFDLDGVLTDTAAVHTVAWKEMFDAYLRERDGEDCVPFDPGVDYPRYVDGKPRADGVRAFLRSRGIELPDGDRDDGPEKETVHGLGARKNELVLALIERDGVEVFAPSVAYLHAVRAAGLRTAVVSSSANTRQVLEVTGLTPLLDVRMDALVANARGLKGKPAPDTFLAAAADLGGGPRDAAVFEDALAGVQAGVAGGFAYVVGVDRADQAEALRAAGADVVVRELDELMAR
jgi:beta-phosphoglucomutase family hydrolase